MNCQQLSASKLQKINEEIVIEKENRSPVSKLSHSRAFSSPINIASFVEQVKGDNMSPDYFLEFTNSFNRILENENQENENQMFDVMGNRICEFDPKIQNAFEGQEDEDSSSDREVYEDDKENDIPLSYMKTPLKTPLKIGRSEVRSPLQNITPTMTQKKKKNSRKMPISEKQYLLTPRTMEKSGFNTSSRLKKVDRF